MEGRLRDALTTGLTPSHLEIVDTNCGGGCGDQFRIVVVSDKFEGKRLLERQRLVNETVGALMDEIHALQMKCKTPEEWGKSSE